MNLHSQKTRIAAVLFAAAGIAGCLLLFYLHETRTHPMRSQGTYRATKTLALIRCLDTALQMYSASYGTPPLVRKTTENSSNNVVLAEILARTIDSQKEGFLPKSYIERNPGLRDEWERPLHIVLATNSTGPILVGANLVEKAFAIWSDGEDGINQAGSGDDLSNWTTSEIRRSPFEAK